MDSKSIKLFIVVAFFALFVFIGIVSVYATADEFYEPVPMSVDTVIIDGSVSFDDGGQASSRPDEISISLMADGVLIAQTTASKENDWEYSFEVNVDSDDIPSYSIEAGNVPGYFEDSSAKVNPSVSYVNPTVSGYTKYEPNNQLAIPTEKLGSGVIIAKPTANKPVVVWSEKPLTLDEQAAIAGSLAGVPGAGNPKEFTFINGDGASSSGMQVNSADGIVRFDRPNNWALLYGGVLNKGGFTSSDGSLLFRQEVAGPVPTYEPDIPNTPPVITTPTPDDPIPEPTESPDIPPVINTPSPGIPDPVPTATPVSPLPTLAPKPEVSTAESVTEDTQPKTGLIDIFSSLSEAELSETEAQLKTEELEFEKLRLRALKEENPDFAGWLSIENTNINYPVMLTEYDKYYYLDKSFSKHESYSGTPFISSGSPGDSNIIISAHNIGNGTMFSDLPEYRRKEFWKYHKEIRFNTLQSPGTYEIIGAFKEKVHDSTEKDAFRYYNYGGMLNEKEFTEFVKNVKELSLYDTGVSAEYGDELLTLSTCYYHTDNGRFIVVAVKK